MKYVEFYDKSSGQTKIIGEMRLIKGRLVMSKELVPHWPRNASYLLLGKDGYETMYDPDKTLEAMQYRFTDPEFQASEVKTRNE